MIARAVDIQDFPSAWVPLMPLLVRPVFDQVSNQALWHYYLIEHFALSSIAHGFRFSHCVLEAGVRKRSPED